MYTIDFKAMAERLLALRVELNIKSNRQFGYAIGITASNESYWNKCLRGECALSEKFLSKLQSDFGVSKQWVLYGKGEKYAPIEAAASIAVLPVSVTSSALPVNAELQQLKALAQTLLEKITILEGRVN